MLEQLLAEESQWHAQVQECAAKLATLTAERDRVRVEIARVKFGLAPGKIIRRKDGRGFFVESVFPTHPDIWPTLWGRRQRIDGSWSNKLQHLYNFQYEQKIPIDNKPADPPQAHPCGGDCGRKSGSGI